MLTALRSTGLTSPVLAVGGVDDAYRRCTHAADQGLIRDGLRIRSASQRSSCGLGSFATPAWFCDVRGLTLARIERVDFDLFLSDLDWDDASTGLSTGAQPAHPLAAVAGGCPCASESPLCL